MVFHDSAIATDEIAEALDVGSLLTGSVNRSGDRLRVNVQLVDVASEESVWAETFDRTWSVDALLDVQAEIAEAVALALASTLTDTERASLASAPTRVPEAYDAYLRGVEYFDSGGGEGESRIAVQYLEQAVELDSTFALAWAFLARAREYLFWQSYERTEEQRASARDAVDRALEEFAIAEGLGGRYASLHGAFAAVYRRQGRMEEALNEFLREQELDPLKPMALAEVSHTVRLLRRLGESLEWANRYLELVPDGETGHELKALAQLAGAGGTAAAMETFGEAERLAVVAPRLALTRVRAALQERNWDRAIREAESTRFEGIGDSQFQFLPPRLLIGLAESRKGNDAEARAAFSEAAEDLEIRLAGSPDDERYRGALGLAYAGLDRTDDALREARRAVELMPVEREAWRGVFRLGELAAVHAWVGNPDSAIAHLDALLSRPGELTTYILRHEPAWDRLRDNPAFERMVARHEAAGR